MLRYLLFLFSFVLSPILSFAQISLSPSPISGKIEFVSLNAISINLTNLGTSPHSPVISIAAISPDTSNGFSIQLNRCQGRTLAPKQSCYIVVSYDKNQTILGQTKEVELKDGSSVLTILKGSNISSLSEASFSSTISSINFGSFINQIQSSIPKNITLLNIGQKTGAPIIETPQGVSVSLNRCSNGVKPGQSCSVSFSFKNSSSLPSIVNAYSGNIVIKKNISDLTPIVIPVQAVLLDRCPIAGYEFSNVLNTCVDMRPQLKEALAGFVNPTAFTGQNTQNLGIFTPTMNGGFDVIMFKKDPKGGTLSYQIQMGDSLSTLTTLTEVPQASNNGTYPTNSSQVFSYLTPSPMFTKQQPYFRFMIPYTASSGTKNLVIKITATSSVSGYSNSITFSSSYQNDMKFAYANVEGSANTSQKTIRSVSNTLFNNPTGTLFNYRDILYINPAQNSLSFKFKVNSLDMVNAYSPNSNAKEQILITEPASVSSGGVVNAKILAFYEYNRGTSSFQRIDTLDEDQALTCSRNSGTGEISCVGSNSNFASSMHGKVIQARVRLISPETYSGRSLYFNYLVLNNINGTPCSSSPDLAAAPFHGIKVVDWNGDGKIQSTDSYMQICTATQLRSLSYSSLASPIGISRQSQVNYRLESDIDMSPYYAGGGYKFYIRQLMGHFDGQGHKISNFIIDISQNTKNNSGVTTSEATVGPNLVAGNGGYSGPGALGQLGIFARLIGARVSDLIIENSQVIANGWTNVGSLAGMAYHYGPNMGTQGSSVYLNQTSDSNIGAPSKNEISNVVIQGVGVDGNGRSNTRVKASSAIGGMLGSITGDRDALAQFVLNSYVVRNSKIKHVSLDTDNLFTQGAITIGGLSGSSENGQISQSSISDIDVKDISLSDYSFIGGIIGYSTYSKMNDVSLIGLKAVVQASTVGLVAIGGAVGVDEDRINNTPPIVYYPTKSIYSNLLIAFDFNTSNFSLSGGFLNIGKFHAFLKNAELTDSVALGELNASSFTSNFTGVYAGSIATYVEMAAPTDSFIDNVSTESYAGINKCGVTNTMCDANPTVPVGYSSSYFTNPSGGSPSIQNWDFVNIWRAPISGEIAEIPYLIGL